MEPLRMAPTQDVPVIVPCSRCQCADRPWDRIAGKAYCPNCQEMLALGEGEPLVERTHKHPCAVCNKVGSVCFHTFPLHGSAPVAMDLCAEHLRALLARRLGPYAFNQLRRQLETLGIHVEELFLLHGAFYDDKGRALRPVLEFI